MLKGLCQGGEHWQLPYRWMISCASSAYSNTEGSLNGCNRMEHIFHHDETLALGLSGVPLSKTNNKVFSYSDTASPSVTYSPEVTMYKEMPLQ